MNLKDLEEGAYNAHKAPGQRRESAYNEYCLDEQTDLREQRAILLSLAISAKRIADILESKK